MHSNNNLNWNYKVEFVITSAENAFGKFLLNNFNKRLSVRINVLN